MDKHELAGRLGVSIRTIERWLKIGCPHARDDMGALVFDEPAVVAWARDRDLLRRYEQLRREQSRQRPVDRDW